ncbi:hypothetical protein [Mucilaginibacter flavidus]|uniref:hypothetical protein n=1 Tax=Mucilaginibacter flavidus TaxID=2949309 RepID=UPI0020924BF6|nr:hypothetical protein [Mucilaginibacter flavidus]MCO5947484.1 hypothetical protein [Mucilaginibacter flavidus]
MDTKNIPVVYKTTHCILTALLLVVLPAFCLGQFNAGSKSTPGSSHGAETPALNTILLKIAATSDSLNKKAGVEKLYLQFDKPYYALNDTIWFKAYLLNANYLVPSAKSGFIYADILNDSSKVVKQYRFPVGEGLTWGKIGLSDKEFTPGTYTLKAYTIWMRNYGDDGFFIKQFYISNAGESSLLVNSTTRETTANGISTANVKLLFSDMNKTAYAVKPLQLQVMAGSKRLYNQKLQTGVDGALDVNFTVPDKAPDLAIVATSDTKDKKVIIPIQFNRAENADIQFMPEGGSLVGGLVAKIGIKAVGEDGKGINLTGGIFNQKQMPVSRFMTTHNGMGSFNLDVMPGETYTAKIIFPGGIVKTVPLPAVKSSGTVLHVTNAAESDSVDVVIGATADIAAADNSYFLIGKARGIVCYAAVVSFREGRYVFRKIAKSLFPSGIAHFVLMTTKEAPLNERLVFINHDDNLSISLKSGKTVYDTRDSIGIKLKITDAGGKPVTGSFSMAVTDDAQVKADSLNSENILSRFLLTSDIRGYIEQPGYYLSANKPAVWSDLDNLLLTQGWINYDLKQPPKFEAEPELKVSGHITNAFNKSLKGTHVLLLSKSPAIVKDTLTGGDGRFSFTRFPRVDTPLFIVQAVNKRGKSFNVIVNIDEVKPPDYAKSEFPSLAPWYVNSDTTLLNYTKTNKVAKQQEYAPDGGHILKEVKITAKKIVKDSQNLNGSGNADQVLDEKELEKLSKKTFLDVLMERVKGFKETYPKGIPSYVVDEQGAWFIIDGYDFYTIIQPDTHEDIKYYLKSHNAEDIKGIEVSTTEKNTSNYYRRFCPECLPSSVAFIEITTRSGHGPIIGNTPGVYLYKPLPISWPKQFYKPKYLVKDATGKIPDLRSTINWEPNIVTDINGEASVSFYSAGSASTYTIIVEGTDMSGNLGYTVKKLTIKK